MEDNITLEQALNGFLKKNTELFSERTLSKEGEEFLKCHDVAHVVFGCDTTFYGEGVVKIWTTFGTTLGFWKVVNGYNEASAFELFRLYSFRHVVKNIGRFLLVIPKVITKAKRMTKPWPFNAYRAYLKVPIADIRREFNIEVLP